MLTTEFKCKRRMLKRPTQEKTSIVINPETPKTLLISDEKILPVSTRNIPRSARSNSMYSCLSINNATGSNPEVQPETLLIGNERKSPFPIRNKSDIKRNSVNTIIVEDCNITSISRRDTLISRRETPTVPKDIPSRISINDHLQMASEKETELLNHYMCNSFYSLHILARYYSDQLTCTYRACAQQRKKSSKISKQEKIEYLAPTNPIVTLTTAQQTKGVPHILPTAPLMKGIPHTVSTDTPMKGVPHPLAKSTREKHPRKK